MPSYNRSDDDFHGSERRTNREQQNASRLAVSFVDSSYQERIQTLSISLDPHAPGPELGSHIANADRSLP
ncbi:hypothetical protein E4U28_004775 [Claviceps purpurea]|nr:hypothetical protein E4U28_004775 [Claviceps purpurea]